MRRFLCIIFVGSLLACGRYITPRSPDELIPAAVTEIQAVLDPTGKTLQLSWVIPEQDISGKKLKETIGYRVEVADSSETNVLSDLPIEKQFTEVAFIPDTYFDRLEQKKIEVSDRGDIVRKIKLPAESKTITYVVNEVPIGTSLYRIYSVNSEGGDGDIQHAVEVVNTSEIKSAVVIKQIREKP